MIPITATMRHPQSRAKRIRFWKNIVDTIAADYQKLSAACDAAIAIGCMDINGPLFEAIWRNFENMLNMIDDDGLIDWYVNENKCGAKGLSHSAGKKKPAPITNSTDLAKLIIATIDRVAANAS